MEYLADTPVEVVIDHAYFDRYLPEAGGATDVDRPRSVSEARVWVVIRGGTDPVVFSQFSPWLGCRVMVATAADAIGFGHTPPDEFEVGFLDPCHGGLFSIDGEHLAGPGAAGLRRFPVRIDADGTLLVDLTDLQAG
jgi:Rieske Fe-S protein